MNNICAWCWELGCSIQPPAGLMHPVNPAVCTLKYEETKGYRQVASAAPGTSGKVELRQAAPATGAPISKKVFLATATGKAVDSVTAPAVQSPLPFACQCAPAPAASGTQRGGAPKGGAA